MPGFDQFLALKSSFSLTLSALVAMASWGADPNELMVNGKPYRKRQEWWQDPDSYVWHTRVVLIGKWKACIPHTNLLQSLDWQSFF